MRVLISDKLDETAFSLFAEKNIVFDYQPDISADTLLATISSYEGLIVRGRTKVTKEVIEKGIHLKVIARAGSGVDNIDTSVAREKNIAIVNAPDANAQAVAEHTIGLILSLLRNYPQAFSSMREGQWLKKELKGSELGGKTVGIIGFGHIGKRVEVLLEAFGIQTLIFSKLTHTSSSLSDIFSQADIVTLHIPLNSETKGLVTKELLQLMKPTAYLINTSRGEIVDEDALYELVSTGKIAGVALDVFWQEPLPPESRWRTLPNVILTPHIGAHTKEALVKASRIVVEEVIANMYEN